MQLAQSEKLSTEAARALLERVGIGATRYLADLGLMDRARARERVEAYRFALRRRTWRSVPDVKGCTAF